MLRLARVMTLSMVGLLMACSELTRTPYVDSRSLPKLETWTEADQAELRTARQILRSKCPAALTLDHCRVLIRSSRELGSIRAQIRTALAHGDAQ